MHPKTRTGAVQLKQLAFDWAIIIRPRRMFFAESNQKLITWAAPRLPDLLCYAPINVSPH